ncbi:UNVERIFIED_CONTAM: hypothetical protein Sradi_2042900 [Sesamum radiatum]|uniref:Ty3 transposon capsid-like protein domain-containing protein n=1 Tax=Sesamum radiatum TaxID=300843 RepID=A0AAW2TK15_SESRA
MRTVFDIDDTLFDAKVKLAAVHMEGKALQWHQVYMISRLTREVPRWEEYVRALNNRFGAFFYEGSVSELMNLKQTGMIQEYMDRFDELLNCLELTEAYATSCFLGRLREEIVLQVRMFKPKTMQEMINLARLQEQALKLSSSSRNSLSINNHKSSSHFNRPLAFTQPSKPPVPNFSTSYASNRFMQMPAHKVANQNCRPLLQFRRMSSQEMDEKAQKVYATGVMKSIHRVTNVARGNRYIMEALEEDENLMHKEVEEEEYQQQQQDVPTKEDDCSNFHISINAMTGVHNFNAMRVIGCCKGKPINILIDIGRARRLSYKLKATDPFPIAVANGNRVYSTHMCKNFNWRI